MMKFGVQVFRAHRVINIMGYVSLLATLVPGSLVPPWFLTRARFADFSGSQDFFIKGADFPELPGS